MINTIITIFILVILCGVGLCIWDYLSNLTIQEERKKVETEKAEKARMEFPPIEDWISHPLYKATISFLTEKIDYFIQCAKETVATRNGIFSIGIEIKPNGAYLFSNIQNYTFYFSSIGYDNIKVGYYEEESNQACRDLAAELVIYLRKYYQKENINISDVNYFIDPEGYFASSIKFWIDLSNLMSRLKQV